MIKSVKNYLATIRIWQWFKSFVVFTLPIGSGTTDLTILTKVLLSFFALSFLSSSIYIFNDLKDLEIDAKHPIKKFRPIASGKIKKWSAVKFSIALLIFGLITLYFLNLDSFYFGLLYIFLGSFYTLKLKFVPYLDSLVISSLFLFRLLIGGHAADISPSIYLSLFIFTISYALALSKRISILQDARIDSDSMYKKFLLSSYNEQTLLNHFNISLIFGVLTYTFWVISEIINTTFHIKSLFQVVTIFIMVKIFYEVYKLTISYGLEDFVLGVFRNKIIMFYISLNLLFILLGIYL